MAPLNRRKGVAHRSPRQSPSINVVGKTINSTPSISWWYLTGLSKVAGSWHMGHLTGLDNDMIGSDLCETLDGSEHPLYASICSQPGGVPTQLESHIIAALAPTPSSSSLVSTSDSTTLTGISNVNDLTTLISRKWNVVRHCDGIPYHTKIRHAVENCLRGHTRHSRRRLILFEQVPSTDNCNADGSETPYWRMTTSEIYGNSSNINDIGGCSDDENTCGGNTVGGGSDSDSDESGNAGKLEVTELQALIIDTILENNKSCHADTILGRVAKYWGNLRKRDGTPYANDYRRAVMSGLTNSSHSKLWFIRHVDAFGESLWSVTDRALKQHTQFVESGRTFGPPRDITSVNEDNDEEEEKVLPPGRTRRRRDGGYEEAETLESRGDSVADDSEDTMAVLAEGADSEETNDNNDIIVGLETCDGYADTNADIGAVEDDDEFTDMTNETTRQCKRKAAISPTGSASTDFECVVDDNLLRFTPLEEVPELVSDDHSVVASSLGLTDLQILIIKVIARYDIGSLCTPVPFEYVFGNVNPVWQLLRRRDGSCYTTDCRRACQSSLANNPSVPIFRRALGHSKAGWLLGRGGLEHLCTLEKWIPQSAVDSCLNTIPLPRALKRRKTDKVKV